METGLQYTNIHSCSDQVLANRVHLLLIVLPHLLTFSIHFIHCSEIIDVIQQNCGFDNCRQEITRIGLPWTSKTFCHTDMYLWMPMFPFYMYRYLHSIIKRSILYGFKQISTYILAIRDASRLKPLEVYLVIHEIAHQVNFNSG